MLRVLKVDLETTLMPILHKDIINISTGMSAQISKTSIKKMGSNKAIQKSINNGFSQEEHFNASKKIQELYRQATLKETRDDTKHGDPAIKIHIFIAPLNEKAKVRILIKESLDKNVRKIYTLELENSTKV